VAEIEDRGQGSQEGALRRGWGKKFSFVKLLDGEDIFQKSESPSKRKKNIFQKTASDREIADHSVTILYCITVDVYDADTTTSHWRYFGRRGEQLDGY
jgi:hypothetical protein